MKRSKSMKRSKGLRRFRIHKKIKGGYSTYQFDNLSWWERDSDGGINKKRRL